jgi:uncharacterized repeat protein (TIGR03803 family)
MDSQGNLYGTTRAGGANGNGTVFVINQDRTGRILYSFNSGTDGAYPVGGLVMDSHGNLYGTTAHGGLHGIGTAFIVSPSGTETILDSFSYGTTAASTPNGRLLMDKQGNLYGTTMYGGTYNQGTAFKLRPFTILHSFGGFPDGAYPTAGLIMDSEGNLLGTAYTGGPHRGGTVFEITP